MSVTWPEKKPEPGLRARALGILDELLRVAYGRDTQLHDTRRAVAGAADAIVKLARPMTWDDTNNIAHLLHAAQGGWKVARLINGDVITGTARHFVKDPDSAAFLSGTDDVRDAYLRVTTTQGMEVFWPISDLAPEVGSGEFVAPYDG